MSHIRRYDVYTDNFFFFKQKTAYDMRISDWSSDVCSSDLGDRGTDRAGPPAAGLGKGGEIDARAVEAEAPAVQRHQERRRDHLPSVEQAQPPGVDRGATVCTGLAAQVANSRPIRYKRSTTRDLEGSDGAFAVRDRWHPGPGQHRADRKSTRLNPSH